MNIIPNFLVFEGGDGSGTTTQVSLLGERLEKSQKPAFFPTFEPTDGQIGKIIRSALKKECNFDAKTLAFLFAADRNEHIYGKNGILEHSKQGKLVICDRFVLSSLVYQGIECGDDLPQSLNSCFPMPELTIFLDIEPEIAIERMKNRTSHEIYEYREFQEKVREKYKTVLASCSASGARVEIIDASKPAQEIADLVWSSLKQMPIFK